MSVRNMNVIIGYIDFIYDLIIASDIEFMFGAFFVL